MLHFYGTLHCMQYQYATILGHLAVPAISICHNSGELCSACSINMSQFWGTLQRLQYQHVTILGHPAAPAIPICYNSRAPCSACSNVHFCGTLQRIQYQYVTILGHLAAPAVSTCHNSGASCSVPPAVSMSQFWGTLQHLQYQHVTILGHLAYIGQGSIRTNRDDSPICFTPSRQYRHGRLLCWECHLSHTVSQDWVEPITLPGIFPDTLLAATSCRSILATFGAAASFELILQLSSYQKRLLLLLLPLHPCCWRSRTSSC
jgi:hypothetical protein